MASVRGEGGFGDFCVVHGATVAERLICKIGACVVCHVGGQSRSSEVWTSTSHLNKIMDHNVDFSKLWT